MIRSSKFSCAHEPGEAVCAVPVLHCCGHVVQRETALVQEHHIDSIFHALCLGRSVRTYLGVCNPPLCSVQLWSTLTLQLRWNSDDGEERQLSNARQAKKAQTLCREGG